MNLITDVVIRVDIRSCYGCKNELVRNNLCIAVVSPDAKYSLESFSCFCPRCVKAFRLLQSFSQVSIADFGLVFNRETSEHELFFPLITVLPRDLPYFLFLSLQSQLFLT